jgi:microcin C transport system permease protein
MTLRYMITRFLLMIPTLFGIMLITFVIIQFAPGGPVEHVLEKMHAQNAGLGHSLGGLEPSDGPK